MANEERRLDVDALATLGSRTVTRRDILKLIGAGASVAAVSPLLAACGNGGGATGGPAATAASIAPLESVEAGAIEAPATAVNLDFWNPFTGGDGPYLRGIVEAFNKETPNVQVKFTTQKDLYAALTAGRAAKRLPHVSIVHLDAIPNNAVNGVFQPIDDFIEEVGLSEADFTAELWQNGEWKGQRYGVPLDIHPLTFYWNKDLFEQAGLDPESPPANEEEFRNAAKEITGKASVPGFMVVQGGGGDDFLLGIEWATTFYQLGGEWTNEDYSEALVNSEAGVKSLEFWKSLIDDGTSPKGVEGNSEISAFKQGKNGMVMSGVWETNGYAEALGDRLGAGPVPQIFGPGVWAGSHNMGITTREMSADELQGSKYFIDWISRHSLDWAKAGQVPARESVRGDSGFESLPHIPTIAEQLTDARFFPPIPGASQLLFGPIGGGRAAVNGVTGKKDPKAALDEAAANLSKLLKENKQKHDF